MKITNLVLSMKCGQRIQIGDFIVITIIRTGAEGGKTRIGIEAPDMMEIKRVKKEDYEKKESPAY